MTLSLTTAQTDYTFTLHPGDTRFNRIAGIYIFLIIPRHPELVSGSHSESNSASVQEQIPPFEGGWGM